ncbi:Crp/Fnr family transcriptional regulator [Tardiphaga sp.]|uniref:Crp/Fnr family transcriptional regulator n=1 Tax=Tardiphaga sp. TaxID=1926292 RepID=UPI0026351A28|nr:Crp/Fnr family transcriptional regulator [Tardiphaga sp.]
MSRHLQNHLLAGLDRATFAQIEPFLTTAHLSQGDVISETHATVQKMYFPHGGIISCVVELIGGGAIETGMIGNDGQFGAAAALDHKVSLNLVVMQIAGDVSVIEADRVRDLAQQHPSFRARLMAYEQFFVSQVQQTCACNAVHKVEPRTCKWILRMQKLVGDDLLLTQEFLAQMMGVRRTSVTQVAANMQREGMITYSRGRIHINDLDKIRAAACECDSAVNSHYARIIE